MSPLRKFLAIVFVVTAFAGGTVFMVLAFDAGRAMPQHATVLPQTAALPPFELTDHNGAAFDKESLRGRWTVVFFGFTNCPDICPATLSQLAAARSRVLEKGGGRFPEIILISVDPERDTPEVMAEYVAKFGDGITGVTGSLAEVRRLTASLGIWFQKSRSGHDRHNVEHTAAVMVINKSAELEALFSPPHEIGHFVTDIPLLTGAT